jgi:hypothetical protein
MQPADLGRIDTFRTEEARILESAVNALVAGELEKARSWADDRSEGQSFWLSRDPHRKVTWNLVAHAARLGCLLVQHPRPFEELGSLDEALARG